MTHSMKTKEGEKAFYCAGCKIIYQMFNENKLLPEFDQD